MRRLPVYILIDCSESMAGEPMEAVQKGLAAMFSSLRKDPHALETVCLSVITFDARAKVAVPLTEIAEFSTPTLTIKPGTALGAALQLLAARIKKEVTKTTSESKGDYRPIVFLLTDGQPTDDWEDAAAALKTVKPKLANIYAIGCGNDIDFHVLNEITDTAFHIRDVSGEMIAKFFIWMSASVQSMSQGADTPISLEKSPFAQGGGFDLIDPDNLPLRSDVPMQVFLHCRCMNTRQFYMLRYSFQEEHQVYLARAVHELPDDFFSEGNDVPPAISSDLLYGSVPCPFCGNIGWGQCGNCGQISCNPDPLPPQIQCPSCQTVLRTGESGTFEVTRSSG
ncbi:MAG: VWA domain-containing protein [Planctomycetaceae bacterium]|nr:VWA domain-containing protein [Planctomycetaceae bacterium]